MKLCSNFIASVVVAAVVAPEAFGYPAEVVVELFKAKPPGARAVVEGPIVVAQPAKGVSLSNSHYEFRAVGSDVEVRSIDVGGVRNVKNAPGSPVLKAGCVTVLSSFRPLGVFVGNDRRTYKGTISFQSDNKGHIIIRNRVGVRDYIKSVVGSESNPDFRDEALKAQAVISQTMLARYKPGDTLNDTTEKQAYLGERYVSPQGNQAVDAVWNQILTYRGLPATIYYHSTCAGGTSNGETYFELKPGAYPYLRGVQCRYCLPSPFYVPTESLIPYKEFRKAFGDRVPQVTAVDERKRPLKVKFGSNTTSGFRFWTEVGTKLGWDKVPGTQYQVKQQRDKGVRFVSRGGGHGVGLCQWGANGLAKVGKSYKEILEYYFPGTSIQQTK